MQWHHSDKLLKLDLEKDIHQAFNGEKVNFDVLNDIKKQVEKVDNDPHIPITFSKATNDLKKLKPWHVRRSINSSVLSGGQTIKINKNGGSIKGRRFAHHQICRNSDSNQ